MRARLFLVSFSNQVTRVIATESITPGESVAFMLSNVQHLSAIFAAADHFRLRCPENTKRNHRARDGVEDLNQQNLCTDLGEVKQFEDLLIVQPDTAV